MAGEEGKTKVAGAEITCPYCNGKSALLIPTDRCLPFAKCLACGRLIKAKPGSCCVICDYSEGKCPVSTVK